jgi:hypothetical protein
MRSVSVRGMPKVEESSGLRFVAVVGERSFVLSEYMLSGERGLKGTCECEEFWRELT